MAENFKEERVFVPFTAGVKSGAEIKLVEVNLSADFVDLYLDDAFIRWDRKTGERVKDAKVSPTGNKAKGK